MASLKISLQSVTLLPDAAVRLRICEQNFKKSYGENLDRVISLKGNAVNERALIMRLHLLQAVLCFHQNQRDEARRLLSLAEIEFAQLQISESSVTALVEMGNCVVFFQKIKIRKSCVCIHRLHDHRSTYWVACVRE